MNYEKYEKLLKMALSLTVLMAVFSTGMTVAAVASSTADISVWKPIGQALLSMGPIIAAEWYGYRHCKVKADEIREQQEKEAKEREKAERKARIAEKRAKQQPKKNKKK